MSDPKINESEINVVKQAVLGFVETMKAEKRSVEQQIREKTENVRSTVLGTGASQFSYQDVDNLSRQYKDEFLSYYRNTIHLKIIANASKQIKQAIHEGLINADIVQQEWLEGFEALQNQINQYQAIADRAEALETQLQGNQAVAGNVQELQGALQQRDQLLIEKDQEIMNLNEGMARMENQVNSLGQTMLENSMTIEELQEAINEREITISQLKSQLSEVKGSSAEVELLQQQLQESKDRERELQQQVSSASTDLVTQLQDNLEKTREQVLELRRDLVAKNEELHELRLTQDEFNVKSKQQLDKINELKNEKVTLTGERNELKTQVDNLTSKTGDFENKLSEREKKIEELNSELSQSIASLNQLNDKLAGYEGKVAMSTEEQEKINSELDNLKSQMGVYQETIDYLKLTLGNDVKFRIMALMASISEKVRLDDLAESISTPEKVVQRAILELADQGVIEARKDGRFLFAEKTASTKVPELLIQDAV